MNYNKLRDRAYQCAVAHGWHEDNLSDEHILCLVICEMMEAVEADRKGKHADIKKFNQELDYYIHEMKLYGENYDKAYRDTFEFYIKDTVEDELADTCIRLFDLAGLRGFDLSDLELCIEKVFTDPTKHPSFTEICYAYIQIVTMERDPLDVRVFLLLAAIIKYHKSVGIDILWHIEQKMRYNEMRPYKHGNKKY